MNKKNFIKNVLGKSIIGFPIGITLLMLIYVIVYFSLGEASFSYEVSKLCNIHTMISQLILAGISGFMLTFAFYSISFLQNEELESNFATEHPYKAILTTIAIVFVTFIIIMITSKSKAFSSTISIFIPIIYPIIYAVLGFYLLIKDSITKYYIKKINEKLQ